MAGMITRDELVEALRGHKAEIVEADEWRPIADHVLALIEQHTWTPRQFDAVNAEMADGVIREIGEVLEGVPCCHYESAGKGVAPMFYPEAIMCALKKAAGRSETLKPGQSQSAP